jgi:hypothetical protein
VLLFYRDIKINIILFVSSFQTNSLFFCFALNNNYGCLPSTQFFCENENEITVPVLTASFFVLLFSNYKLSSIIFKEKR